MSYTPPPYTDAGGTITTGYTPPAFTDGGGDLAPLPPGPASLPRTTAAAVRVTVVVLTIDGSAFYFSDLEYGDNQTNWHKARVVGDIAYSRKGGCVLWAEGRGGGGLGNIELINNDGALDELVTGPQNNARVAVYEVDQDQPFSTALQIAAAIVTQIEARGEQTVRVVTGDIMALLDVPLQASLYATGDGAAALIGRPRPLTIGNPLSCPVVLVDDVDYLYDVHDSDTFEAVIVRDMGYPLTETTPPSTGWRVATATGINGIELLQQPVGRVVADLSATSFSAQSIIGAAEGDFATDLTDWTITTVTTGGGTASATWDPTAKALLEADKLAVPTGVSAYVDLTFPTALTAGQRYDYTLAAAVTVAGIAGYALVQVFFEPTSLAPGEYVQLGLIFTTTTTTVAGTFTAPAAGKFVIRASAASGASVEALFDTVRLDRVSSGGNVADVIELLLARAGIGVDQIDSASLAALAAARPWACSYWTDKAERIGDVLQKVLDSVYGWTYTNAAGQIAVGFLEPPETGTSVLDLTDNDLALGAEIEVEADTAPGLSTTVAGARNFYIYGEGELADSITDADRVLLTADYRIRCTATDPVGVELGNRAGAAVSDESLAGIATLLDEETHIQAAADYLAELYPADQPRRFYTLPVLLSQIVGANINPGDKITFTSPRFGCASGRPMRVIEPKGLVGDEVLKLRCWASAVD